MAFVCTTPRKGSSASKKLAMHERQDGICPLCKEPMIGGEKLIDEHMTALGLGGSNDDSNRALVHAHCAYAKTFGRDGDIAVIARAKRQKIHHLGLKESKHRIPQPPRKSPRNPATSPVEKLAGLPRNTFTERSR